MMDAWPEPAPASTTERRGSVTPMDEPRAGNPWSADPTQQRLPERQPVPRYADNRRPQPAAPHHADAERRRRGPPGIGDGDIMPPRFDGDRQTDAVDWAQDFLDYVYLRDLTETDARVLLRTRLAGAAKTWLESVPNDAGVEDILARLR